MVITLAEAEQILQAAKAKASEMGVIVAIAVVDPRGDLVAMVRSSFHGPTESSVLIISGMQPGERPGPAQGPRAPMAACTPPLRWGTPLAARLISMPASAPISVSSLRSPR